MNLDVQRQIDWLDWLQRWDAWQEGYVPERSSVAAFDTFLGGGAISSSSNAPCLAATSAVIRR